MHLKSKSDENIKCASRLVSDSFFNPSVHCSYYSCIQYIKHLLLNKYNLTEEIIREEQKEKGQNAHTYLERKIYSKIKQREEKRVFNANFVALKKARVDADYLEVTIEQAQAQDYVKRASEILQLLKKIQ